MLSSSEDFHSRNYCVLHEDKWLLVGVLNDTDPYISRSSTTKKRELNHLWKFFLQRKLTLVS